MKDYESWGLLLERPKNKENPQLFSLPCTILIGVLVVVGIIVAYRIYYLMY